MIEKAGIHKNACAGNKGKGERASSPPLLMVHDKIGWEEEN